VSPDGVTHGHDRVLAFIDLGTNSLRLLVVRLSGADAYTVISEQKETVRLGDGEFGTDHLAAGAMDRAVIVAGRFAQLARSFGAEEIVAVATSAAREARNSDLLLSRLRVEAGLDLHIIPGLEEARLIYLGVSSGLALGDRSALFIDIGGGSTELAVGTAKDHTYLSSVKLGSLRLLTLFPPRGPGGAYDARGYDELREYCRSVLLRPFEELSSHQWDLVVGSSGTIQALVEVAGRMNGSPGPGGALELSASDLGAAVRLLAPLGLEERRAVPGLAPSRADIIVPGAAILETIFECLGIDLLRTTNRGLKEGLLIDHLSRRGLLPPHGEEPVRDQSVSRLARNCRATGKHSLHVANLAGQLFDSGRAIGLHDLGGDERELLGYAARLHDCGTFLAFSDHHLHSHYIITNAELPGFDRREIVLMGLVARLHRKKLPGSGSRELGALEPGDRRLVLVLAVLLRLAESLDRTHAGIVSSARFETANGGVSLVLSSDADPHLEIWGAENQARAFRKVFGRPLGVVVERSKRPCTSRSIT
jgi:exopolyphosphatase/guanosine-5'-triphosphate,3'-diphosphate pyrophosphatase